MNRAPLIEGQNWDIEVSCLTMMQNGALKLCMDIHFLVFMVINKDAFIVYFYFLDLQSNKADWIYSNNKYEVMFTIIILNCGMRKKLRCRRINEKNLDWRLKSRYWGILFNHDAKRCTKIMYWCIFISFHGCQ